MQYNEQELSLKPVRTTELRINRISFTWSLHLDIIQFTPSWYFYQVYVVSKT